MTAADLSAVTGSTAGTVTLSNSQTITGTGAQVKAALVTDAVTAASSIDCKFWCCDISS